MHSIYYKDMRYVCEISAVCALLSSFCVYADEARQTAGEVVSVSGTVLIRPDGEGNKILKPAKPGDALHAGDVINTASSAKVKILLHDKTILDIGPSALFKMDKYKENAGADRQVDANMVYGSVRAAVAQKLGGNGHFRLKTPTAIMGVRGTEFVVSAQAPSLQQLKGVISNPDKPMLSQRSLASVGGSGNGMSSAISAARTEITVLQGAVDVQQKPTSTDKPASKQPVSLTAGKQMTMKEGEAAPAKPVTVEPQKLSQISAESRVADNTFSKAVVIDGGKDSGAGASTRAALGNSIALPS
ncbi:MAG: FecR family protein, partial [Bdellovibrionota bacterium]